MPWSSTWPQQVRVEAAELASYDWIRQRISLDGRRGEPGIHHWDEPGVLATTGVTANQQGDELSTMLIIYGVGVVVAFIVFHFRAGLGSPWSAGGQYKHSEAELGFTYNEFKRYNGMKMLVWPIVFIHWLATGRPEPRYVYDKGSGTRP